MLCHLRGIARSETSEESEKAIAALKNFTIMEDQHKIFNILYQVLAYSENVAFSFFLS